MFIKKNVGIVSFPFIPFIIFCLLNSDQMRFISAGSFWMFLAGIMIFIERPFLLLFLLPLLTLYQLSFSSKTINLKLTLFPNYLKQVRSQSQLGSFWNVLIVGLDQRWRLSKNQVWVKLVLPLKTPCSFLFIVFYVCIWRAKYNNLPWMVLIFSIFVYVIFIIC